LIPYLFSTVQALVYGIAGLVLYARAPTTWTPLALTYLSGHFLRAPGTFAFFPVYFGLVLLVLVATVQARSSDPTATPSPEAAPSQGRSRGSRPPGRSVASPGND
jgi:hypothetical protein